MILNPRETKERRENTPCQQTPFSDGKKCIFEGRVLKRSIKRGESEISQSVMRIQDKQIAKHQNLRKGIREKNATLTMRVEVKKQKALSKRFVKEGFGGGGGGGGEVLQAIFPSVLS